MHDWIAALFRSPDMLRMGHRQRAEDLNLGMGWVYYALARLLRPRRVVVIGSYRGFVPLVFGKALHDNGRDGSVWFIDPSLADDFWKQPRVVAEHFAGFGVTNIRHFLMTTQDFVASDAYATLGPIELVHIDGWHTEEQAEFDFNAFSPKMTPESIALFHDSVAMEASPVYGPDRAYTCTVRRFIDRLKQRPELQVFDLPFGPGLTLVRLAELPPAEASS
jgi:predicted O-methyltransferase YrrM